MSPIKSRIASIFSFYWVLKNRNFSLTTSLSWVNLRLHPIVKCVKLLMKGLASSMFSSPSPSLSYFYSKAWTVFATYLSYWEAGGSTGSLCRIEKILERFIAFYISISYCYICYMFLSMISLFSFTICSISICALTGISYISYGYYPLPSTIFLIYYNLLSRVLCKDNVWKNTL